MKKKITLIIAVVLLSFVLSYAVDTWVSGIAIFGTSDTLNGWTITCGGGTYGTTISESNGGFGLSWSLRPPADYYYLTTDSSGQRRRYSGYFYCDGSSYGTGETWYFSSINPG